MPLVRKGVAARKSASEKNEANGDCMLVSITEDGRPLAVVCSTTKKVSSKAQCVVFKVLKKIVLAVANDIRVRNHGVQCLRHDDTTARVSLPKGVGSTSFLEHCRKKAPILLSAEYITAGSRSEGAALCMSRSRRQRAEQREIQARKEWETEFGGESSEDDEQNEVQPPAATRKRKKNSATAGGSPTDAGAGKRDHGRWAEAQLALGGGELPAEEGNRSAVSSLDEDHLPSPKRRKQASGEEDGTRAYLNQTLQLLEQQKELLVKRHEEIKQALESPVPSTGEHWLEYYVKNFGFCVYTICRRRYPKGSTLRHSAAEASKVIASKDTKRPYVVRPHEPVLMAEKKDTRDTFSKVFTQDKTQGYVRTAALIPFDIPAEAAPVLRS